MSTIDPGELAELIPRPAKGERCMVCGIMHDPDGDVAIRYKGERDQLVRTMGTILNELSRHFPGVTKSEYWDPVPKRLEVDE